jgi:hypothetical protein
MILKIFSPKNLAKKLAFLTQNRAKFWKKIIITLVIEKNANFLPKIGKNCDHNIDSCSQRPLHVRKKMPVFPVNWVVDPKTIIGKMEGRGWEESQGVADLPTPKKMDTCGNMRRSVGSIGRMWLSVAGLTVIESNAMPKASRPSPSISSWGQCYNLWRGWPLFGEKMAVLTTFRRKMAIATSLKATLLVF